MTALQALLVIKLLAVMTYAGGFIASFVSRDLEDRRRAVHGVASPALFMTWCAGYGLAWLSDVGPTELWILGGLALSFVTNAALVRSVGRERSRSAFASCALPLVAVVVLMVFKPTWEMVLR